MSRTLVPLLVTLATSACGARSVREVPAADPAARDAGATVDRAAALPDAPSSALDPAVRACLMAASCDPAGAAMRLGDETATASACLDSFAFRHWPTFSATQGIGISQAQLDLLLGCGAQRDCKAFHACIGGDLISPASCTLGARCAGDSVAATVGPGDVRSFDCGTIAARCVDAAIGERMACCRPRACDAGPRGDPCAGQLFCSDDPVPSGGFRFDCAATGRRCVAEDPVLLCVGPGERCSEEEPPRCSGSRVTYCAPGGQRATFDCATTTYRSACDPTTSQGSLPCRAAERACDPQGYRGACRGDGVTICVDGREQVVDCAELGFEICWQPRAGDVGARCGFLI